MKNKSINTTHFFIDLDCDVACHSFHRDCMAANNKKSNDDMELPIGWFAFALPVFGLLFGLFVKRGIIKKDADPERAVGLLFAFILMSTVLGFVLGFIGKKMKAPASTMAMISNIIVAIGIIYYRWFL